jgi:hypothetical protein
MYSLVHQRGMFIYAASQSQRESYCSRNMPVAMQSRYPSVRISHNSRVPGLSGIVAGVVSGNQPSVGVRKA